MLQSRTKSIPGLAGSDETITNDNSGLDADTESAMVTSNSTTAKPTTSAHISEGPAPVHTPRADKIASRGSRLTQPTAATVARQKELEAAKAARSEKDAKAKKAAKAVKAAEAAKDAKDAKLKAEKDAVKEAKDAAKEAKNAKAKAEKEAKAKAEKEGKAKVEKEAGIKSEKRRVPMSAPRRSTAPTPTKEEIVMGSESKKGIMKEPKPRVQNTVNTAVGLMPPPPPPKPQPTTARAHPSKALTKPKSSSSSSITTVAQSELDISITTLARQCGSILEGLDEQVQINQALVTDMNKLRQENREFRIENAEIKKRLERIEGIVINILGGDDSQMDAEMAVDHANEGGVADVNAVEEMERVQMIEGPKEEKDERRRSGRKRKSSVVVEKAEEELGKTPRKTRRVTFGKGGEGKGRQIEVVY